MGLRSLWMGASRFWRMVAVMGAFGAGAVLAHSFMSPAEPEPAPPTPMPRKRGSRATAPATETAGDDARRNGHGRAH